MLTDNTYEYNIMRRGVVENGKQRQRYVFVRRRIGHDNWIRVKDTKAFDDQVDAITEFWIYRELNGIRAVGQ